MLKVGDKVLYTGGEFAGLYIERSKVYTVEYINEESSWLRVSEIRKTHSYRIINFILVTDLMAVLV